MRSQFRRLGAFVGLLALSTVTTVQAQTQQREIAITMDDLPAADAAHMAGTDITAMTAKLLGTLRQQKIPAVGFVNERKLFKFGEVDERNKTLSMWLDS